MFQPLVVLLGKITTNCAKEGKSDNERGLSFTGIVFVIIKYLFSCNNIVVKFIISFKDLCKHY